MPDHPVAQLAVDGPRGEHSRRAASQLGVVRARLGLRPELQQQVPGAMLERADQLARAAR